MQEAGSLLSLQVWTKGTGAPPDLGRISSSFSFLNIFSPQHIFISDSLFGLFLKKAEVLHSYAQINWFLCASQSL